ncbi:hypothetical protein HK098_000868 [Nowakowskiella sp. JEL0407]|nr:hypothetical protein HK098_000868 [Nowakowskiella sp. JEL0407]
MTYSTYKRKLIDSLGRKAWTAAEDAELIKAINKVGLGHWTQISKTIEGRTPDACRKRWEKVLDPTIRKGAWLPEEDALLLELVGKYGSKKWTLIASEIKGRTDKQCRQRWFDNLAGNSPEEGAAMVKVLANQKYATKKKAAYQSDDDEFSLKRTRKRVSKYVSLSSSHEESDDLSDGDVSEEDSKTTKKRIRRSGRVSGKKNSAKSPDVESPKFSESPPPFTSFENPVESAKPSPEIYQNTPESMVSSVDRIPPVDNQTYAYLQSPHFTPEKSSYSSVFETPPRSFTNYPSITPTSTQDVAMSLIYQQSSCVPDVDHLPNSLHAKLVSQQQLQYHPNTHRFSPRPRIRLPLLQNSTTTIRPVRANEFDVSPHKLNMSSITLPPLRTFIS